MDKQGPEDKFRFANLQPEELYRLQVRELRGYAMFLIDPDGTIVSWNIGVQQLMGYSEDEWLGRNACMIFTPEEKAAELFESEMKRARELGTATDIRWHKHKDGSEFFAHGYMNAVTNDEGKLVGFTKIISDETARKQLLDALTESNSALEQFASVASHDLQEPLRTMGAYAEILHRKYQGKLDADSDRYLQFIVRGAARMSSLVKDLLDYARLATEEERPTSTALDEDVETALSHLDQSIAESGAIITHDALPVLQVDRGQMVRLFQNLLGNAIKYGKPDEPPKVHISAKKRETDWMISVRDNGIGFDPGSAATIFEPFKRLHTAAEYPGTGVGLAICRKIIQSQGGRIWAESEPGEGATFHFTLPQQGVFPVKRTPPIEFPHRPSNLEK